MMSRDHRIFLSLSIAAALCCTMLLGVAVAADSDKTMSFTRMFPELPPFAPATDAAREQAKRLGEKGGIIDALDDLSDPILSITDPARRVNNRDNPNMTAGMTFLGQFLDHEITFDPNSPLLEKTNPKTTTNFRTARFDLDSVYGGGPERSPELYDPSSSDIKLKIEAIPGSENFSRNGAIRFDLPRDPNTLVAFLGDRRNDENTILSQLHVAMLRFHNAVIDRLRADPATAGDSAGKIFREAQRQVRWHFQWIILHEFLPLTIGQERVDDIMQNGIRFYHFERENPLIPIEFSVAAYRFGHSQIRPSYRLNFGRPEAPYFHDQFFVFIFDDTQDPNNPDPEDLRGFKRAPRRFVDWQTFFKFDTTNFRPNKRIDGKVSSWICSRPLVWRRAHRSGFTF
jgi:Animal haem peroxidase